MLYGFRSDPEFYVGYVGTGIEVACTIGKGYRTVERQQKVELVRDSTLYIRVREVSYGRRVHDRN